jgi:hypothetical protein
MPTTGSVMQSPSQEHGQCRNPSSREFIVVDMSDGSFGNSHFFRLQYPHIEPHQDDQDWRIDVEDLQRRLSSVNSTEWKVGQWKVTELIAVHHIAYIPLALRHSMPCNRRVARSSTRHASSHPECCGRGRVER